MAAVSTASFIEEEAEDAPEDKFVWVDATGLSAVGVALSKDITVELTAPMLVRVSTLEVVDEIALVVAPVVFVAVLSRGDELVVEDVVRVEVEDVFEAPVVPADGFVDPVLEDVFEDETR